MNTFICKLVFSLMITLSVSCFGCLEAYSEDCTSMNQFNDTLPILSGPVTTLPWDNEESFLKAKRDYNTENLIAAYKTVLLDPLPGEEYNVHLCAKLLCGTVVGSGSVFSQNKTVGPYTTSRGFKKGPTYAGPKLINTTGGGICKIATTLYNISVLSNLPVIERHYHSMPVSYVPYGQDATVAYGSRDFKFKNNTKTPILIWSQGIDDTLYIGFYGNYTSPKVEWHHEIINTRKTTTFYRKNKKLAPGTRNVLVHGMDGMSVKSEVIMTFPDGTVQKKSMGISRYKPLPYVIEIGG